MTKIVFAKCLLLLCLLTTACNDDDHHANGTSDTGGGGIEKSTEAEIRAAVPKALEIIGSEDFFSKISFAGFPDYDSLSKEDRETLARTMNSLQFPHITMPIGLVKELKKDPSESELDAYLEELEKYKEKFKYESAAEYLKADQIYFLKQGPCPAADKANADASVSKFDLGAKVCISIENLKKIPKIDLLKHITGLLTHELCHLFGFRERAAVLIQTTTVSNFATVTGISGQNVPFVLYDSLLTISSTAQNIEFILTGKFSPYTKEITPQSKADATRFLLGLMLGSSAQFEQFLDESGRPVKVFFSAKTKGQEARLLDENLKLQSFLIQSAALSDEELNSPQYLQSVQTQMQNVDILLEKYRELLDFYQD